jgi:hypothetical protein
VEGTHDWRLVNVFVLAALRSTSQDDATRQLLSNLTFSNASLTECRKFRHIKETRVAFCIQKETIKNWKAGFNEF